MATRGWKTQTSIGIVQYDSSGSARVVIFGSIFQYLVHYVRVSESPVGYQICPKSISETQRCYFCEIPAPQKPPDSEISTYNRYSCLVWDTSKNKWAALDGSAGLFREIRRLFGERHYNREDIIHGKTPDVVIQRMGLILVPALLNESSKIPDGNFPPPFDLFHKFMDRRKDSSIWLDYFSLALQRAGNRNRENNSRDIHPLIEMRRSYGEIPIFPPSPRRSRSKKRQDDEVTFEAPIPKRNTDAWDII